MNERPARDSKMVGGHHRPKSGCERPPGIGEEGRDPRQAFLLLGVKDVEDRADQQRMGGLLPMIAPLERTFRIDEDIGDILDVADLMIPAANLKQGVVARGARVGRVEQKAVREKRAPA